jgi:hypothetical protein
MFYTWDEAAEDATKIIFSEVRKTPKVSVSDLRSVLDRFIESLYQSPGGNMQAKVAWCCLGANAVELSQTTLQPLTVLEVTTTLVRKQRDYGPENIRRFGRHGLMVRMHDKIARLENLAAHGRTPENETVHDTYMDIVGYSAIGIMWEDGNFLLPLAES